MRTFFFTTLFLLAVFQQSIIGQESVERHYYVDANEIKTTYFNEVNDDIDIIERKTDRTNSPQLAGAIIGIVIGELVPMLVKNVGLLAYNPKKYISEYGSSYSFKLTALRNTNAIDKITFTRSGIKGKASNPITQFEFDVRQNLKSDNGNLQGYTAIALECYQSKYTKVRLKNSGKKTNVVVEMTLFYYDLQDKKQQLTLEPYKLSGIIPEGPHTESVSIIPAKKNYQIIPPMKFIETVTIKITEINDRKKDWDKYLELFNSQKDNISSFLIDQLN